MKQVSRPVLAAAIALALTAAGCDKLGDKAATDKNDTAAETATTTDAKADKAIATTVLFSILSPILFHCAP